jgi:hypothetical protein
MTTKEFADEKLREGVSKLEFGEPNRNVYAGSQIGAFNLPEIDASITYKFDNGLVIQGNPLTAKKLKKHYDHKNRVSLEDHLEYEKDNEEMYKELRAKDKGYKKDYNAQLKLWKKENPDWRNWNKRKEIHGGMLHIPMCAVTRPTLRQVGYPVGGPKHKLGILIDSYEDKECLTAKLTSVIVRYKHEDGIMNYDKLKETTDIKKDDLPKIREKLCEEYNIQTGNDGGKWSEEKSPGIMIPIPTPKKYQNNVFVAKLTPEMSVDEMVDAVGRVYQAGESFREGLYELQKERKIREEHERNVEERRQDSVLEVF